MPSPAVQQTIRLQALQGQRQVLETELGKVNQAIAEQQDRLAQLAERLRELTGVQGEAA